MTVDSKKGKGDVSVQDALSPTGIWERIVDTPSVDIAAAKNSLPAKVSPGQSATCIAACRRSHVLRERGPGN